MAVHLANILSTKIDFSCLVCTRRSGILEKDLLDSVKFKCLHKRSSLDLKAISTLSNFIKTNKINIIHAHSTSFFIATLIKLRHPKLRVIWHDHYGMSDKLDERPVKFLKLASNFFQHIISVNDKLKTWAQQNLNCSHVTYIQNFSLNNENEKFETAIKLKGNPESFKVIHIANLRPQKDHITALKAIKKLSQESLDITYHLFGGYDQNSEYYKKIISFIEENKLGKSVFIYGSQSNISGLLKQADIGILSSISEGLPVSLIEYAQAKLPVIVTDVGQCKEVVGGFASVINPKDFDALAFAIKNYLENQNNAKSKAEKLYDKVSKEYNPEHIIDRIINIYTT